MTGHPDPTLGEDLAAIRDLAWRFAADRVAPGYMLRERTGSIDHALVREIGGLGLEIGDGIAQIMKTIIARRRQGGPAGPPIDMAPRGAYSAPMPLAAGGRADPAARAEPTRGPVWHVSTT